MTIEELRVLITAKTESLQEGINKATSKLRGFRKTSDDASSTVNKNVQNMKDQYEQLIKKLDNVNAQAELQERKLEGLRQKYSRLSVLGQDSPKATKLQEQILRTESKLYNLISTSDKTESKISELEGKMANVGVSTGKAGERFKTLRDRLEQIKNKFRETGNETQKVTGKVVNFASMLNKTFMRILKRLFIYQLIYKAIRSIVNYMNGALRTNNQFVLSLNTIKTNLRVAFQPIYDFILPAIQALMRGLATITSYIASFTSALFGKTYKQSYDAAKGIETAKKSMDKYGKSAKKAKGELAGFDEVNVLNTDDENTGGGSDSGFEMAMPEMEEFQFGWLDKLREKLEPTIKAFDRLVEALDPLKKFASQGAIDFYNKFLVPVGNWVFGEGLPRFIDAIINGLSKIDWYRINAALNRLWEALTPFAVNVGEGLLWFWENVLVPFGTWVWNEIVPRFLDILTGILKVLNAVIEVFKPLGSWLWENFLLPIARWTGGAIVDVLDGIAYAFNRIAEYIEGIQDVIANSDSFLDALVNVGVYLVKGLFNGIISALSSIGSWLWDNLVKPIVDGVKRLFGINSPSTVFMEIGTWLIEGLFQGISNIWTKITDFFEASLESLKDFLKNSWDSIKEKAVEIWTSIKEFFIETWNSTKENAAEIWDSVKTFFSETWDNIKTKTEEVWNNIKTFLIDKTWNPIKTTAKTIWDVIRKNIIEPIEQSWIKLKEIWDKIKKYILDRWDEIRFGIINTKDKLVNAIKEPFNIAKDWIDGVIKDAYNWGKNLIGNIVDGIKSMVGKVKDAVSNVANTIGDFLGFHSPSKKGPGSEADRWMPNLMNMLAEGIEDNVYKVSGAVNITADTLKGIELANDSNSIASAVGSAVMAAMQLGNVGQSSKESGDIILQIDGVTIGRILGPIIDKEKGRIGSTIIQPI